MASRRPADWRFPTDRQQRTEATARRMQANAPAPAAPPPLPTPGPADAMPDAYWDAVLHDPRAVAGAPRMPLAQQALRDIRQHLLRVSCRRCDRIVEIQTADAVRLFGAGVTWKDAGRRLLDGNCQQRTGSHEDDGCWPSYDAP